jgi:aldose 1-epimerase
MQIKQRSFGTMADGRSITEYTIINESNLSVGIINYGAIITSVKMQDRNGKSADITLGFDTLERYAEPQPFLGSVVGRFANRIAGGRFAIDGVQYKLARNDHGIHHLHGGEGGFYKVVWQAEPFVKGDSAGLVLTYMSADGEEGYPGNLAVKVIYSLNQSGELRLEYTAQTDKPTPVNLTNHAYWNLTGAGSGGIENHLLRLNCSRYLPVTETLVPTGEIKDVAGTYMDFKEAKPVGRDLDKVPGGYDHCYIIDRNSDGLAEAARVTDPASGRCLDVFTTKPAIQFYSGNFLNRLQGRNGEVYDKHGGLCLETEYYPDAVNRPEFPDVILRPGQEYRHVTVYKFSIMSH